jgi:hypothetical protein
MNLTTNLNHILEYQQIEEEGNILNTITEGRKAV